MNQSQCIQLLVKAAWHVICIFNWICNHWTENYSDEDYASIMDEEVSVFKYLGWGFQMIIGYKRFLGPLRWSFVTNSPNRKCVSTKMNSAIANVLNQSSFKRFIWWQCCWWHRYVGDCMMVTLWWWLYDFQILVTESLCWRLFPLFWWFNQCI